MNADRFRIYNETRHCLVARDVEAADGTTADVRLIELTPDSKAALWIFPLRDLSPACAPTPLDLIYVSKEGVVLDTVEFFPMNGRGLRSEQAASVIAFPADTVARVGTRPGDRLQFSADEQKKELSENQNGNGHVPEANAPIAEPENGGSHEIQTGETDPNWMRITDVTMRTSYDAEETREAVEFPRTPDVDPRRRLLAIPSIEDFESLLQRLREPNGDKSDGSVMELTGKKREEFADTPGASSDTVLHSIRAEEPAALTIAGEHLEGMERRAESEFPRGTEPAGTNGQTEGKPAEIVADAASDSAIGAGARPTKSLSEVQEELTGVALAAEKNERGDAAQKRIACDAADKGVAGQVSRLTLYSTAEPGVQLTLFPTVELERISELPQGIPLRGSAGADAMPGAGISALVAANAEPVPAFRDPAGAKAREKEEPATSPSAGWQMPGGGANEKEDSRWAIAPTVERAEFSRPKPVGSVAADEIVQPVYQRAIAGYEAGTVRVEYPKETNLQSATAAQSIFRSGAGAAGHADTTSAERTSGTNGAAGGRWEPRSNSFAAELPRSRVPGRKPNAERVWAKRGVGPTNWIERILLEDTVVRRSIQSLLLNDTAMKNWLLRWLVGTNPKDNWIEDMLSTEFLDPRRGPRENVPGLIAYFFTGGPAVQHPIRDISASGLYMVTKVRWYEGTVVQLTLTDQERPTDEGSMTVQGKVVRTGDDGVGFELLLEGSPAHDGPFERHVPTNGVGVAHLGGLLRMIKSKHVREQQAVGIR